MGFTEFQFMEGSALRFMLRWGGALLIGAILLGSDIPGAQRSNPGEYQVKAEQLVNFGKFVTWPAESPAARADAFTICVIGQDPFGAVLDAALSGEKIGGKAVVPRRISRPNEVNGCRILFISSSESKRLQEVLNSLGDSSVLTVSDIPDFSQRGGMLGFVQQDNKVRFEVSLRPVEMARLTLSSDLLRVAVTVRKN